MVALRRYRHEPRDLNWSSSVGLCGGSISICPKLALKLSRRASSLNLRFLGNKDGEVLPLLSGSNPGERGEDCNSPEGRSRCEKDRLACGVKAGESALMSLNEPRRSTKGFGLEGGDKLTLSQEKIDFRCPKFGEHGAECGSFLMAGNLSMLEPSSSELSAFLGQNLASLFVVGFVPGIIRVNFFRNFLASKSIFLSN